MLSDFSVVDPGRAGKIRKHVRFALGSASGEVLRKKMHELVVGAAAAWMMNNESSIKTLHSVALEVGKQVAQTAGQTTRNDDAQSDYVELYSDSLESGLGTIPLSDLKRSATELNTWFRDFFVDLGRSRYMMTIVLAAGYDRMANPTVSDRPRSNKDAQECLELIDDICRSVRSSPQPARSSTIIDRVFTASRELYLRGDTRTFAQYALPDGVSQPASKQIRESYFELQEEILWHLSAIGHPVDLTALTECPDVARVAIKLKAEIPSSDVAGLVGNAVTTLVARCLVFRVSSRPGDPTVARYVVHRQIQRHVYKTMGAPLVEAQTVDKYSISLYADQPNDAPLLTVKAHSKLQGIVAGLSKYPGQYMGSAKVSGFNLKAALGVLRNCYSVASVARLDRHSMQLSTTDVTLDSLFSGYFEQHRLYLRWLIEQAKQPDSEAPFYSEELVWLYNECGVISFIEGHVKDAAALLDMADQATARLEPSDDGPLRLLVKLNRALVDIDMGHLASARDKLRSVLSVEERQVDGLRDFTLCLLARGYLALVDHINGNFDHSCTEYETVQSKLASVGHSRAAAIFSRHLGDLYRFREKIPEARKVLQEALQFAISGSHEDIRHHILLSQIRLLLSEPEKLKINQVISELELVEDYARIMGIPKLLAEVDELRGKFHRLGGDLSAASTYVSQSLSIASRHGLGIRKASALGLLAEIHLDMGFKEHCREELKELQTVARQIDYQAANVVAQNLVNRLSWQHGASLAPPI